MQVEQGDLRLRFRDAERRLQVVAREDPVAGWQLLGRTVDEDDVRHLLWLREKIGANLLDTVVINTGPEACRRKDGIAVIPAALLGP